MLRASQVKECEPELTVEVCAFGVESSVTDTVKR
jgi:hypothetical protein